MYYILFAFYRLQTVISSRRKRAPLADSAIIASGERDCGVYPWFYPYTFCPAGPPGQGCGAPFMGAPRGVKAAPQEGGHLIWSPVFLIKENWVTR